MSISPKHINNGNCLACQDKLKQACDQLNSFATLLQKILPELHVAWSYRSQTDQDLAFAKGTSKLKWPESKHNALPSQAIDFFRLTPTGVASWDPIWLSSAIGPAARAAGLVYGGDWAKFKDFCHIEISSDKSG